MLIVQEEVHLELLTFDNAKSLPIDKCQRRRDPNNNDLDVSTPVIDIHNEVLLTYLDKKISQIMYCLGFISAWCH
jgi:hypothetical protein